MKTALLYEKLSELIPASLCCSWDNDGLSVLPSPDHDSKKILIALDADIPTVKYAKENGFDTIITHHPLIFRPLGELRGGGAVSQRAIELLKADIAHISFHTRFDGADGGVNDVICGILGVENAQPFGPAGEELGRVGDIPEIPFEELCAKIKEKFGGAHFSASKAADNIKRIAICSGSGSGMTLPALRAGADALFTGELHYHETLDARDLGLSVICAGHYETEAPALCALADKVRQVTGVKPEILTAVQNAF